MKRIAVLDSETTGLFTRDHPLDISQPWPVQVAAVICNGEFSVVETFNLLMVPPEGANFSDKACAMHGYTREAVEANGLDMKTGLEWFRYFVRDCDMYAGYNLPYDERVIKTSGDRVGVTDIFNGTPLDVMRWYSVETDGGRHRLGQAYQHLIGKDIEDAHDAMADVLATVAVMRVLLTKS